MKQEAKEILEFFDGYPAKIRDVALGLRTMIHSAMPDAGEMLDRSAKIVGYGFGPRYADLICVIIPSKKGVKLGIVRATELPDPKGLLEGSGKVHRHIVFAESARGWSQAGSSRYPGSAVRDRRYSYRKTCYLGGAGG